MTLLYVLLGVILTLCAVIAWKLFIVESPGSESDKILRESLENLRRDITETKDKLHDSMGKNAENVQQRLEKTLDLVNKQLGGMDNRIDKRVSEINNRLDSAAELMNRVSKQYGTVEELSGNIKRLQEAFKAPKPRGIFSEKILVDLVAQVLPVSTYTPQHTFHNGAIVDLLIKTANGNICIDAKFPLENYAKLVDTPDDDIAKRSFRADVKKHIKDVAKKYILPDEGTLDFALLYVPSDAVMYEILTDNELSDAAEANHVFILSPHSFYYFLNVIRLAYQSQQFEENAKKILSLIRGIQQQNGKLGEELDVLQKHVSNAGLKMGSVFTEYTRLESQIAQAGSLEQAKDEKQLIDTI